MGPIAEYRVLSVPRFSLTEWDVRHHDAGLAQRALWNVLVFQIVRKHKVTVELRYGCDASGEPAFVSVRLYGTRTPQFDDDIRQVDALLPPEYRWTKLNPSGSDNERQVRIARVVRRIEFLDLPSVSVSTLRGGILAPTTGKVDAAAAQKPAVSLSAGNMKIGFRVVDGELLREVPRAETTFGELETRQFCLPMPGQISQVGLRLNALFQGIQRAGSAVVSICLHPIDETDRRRIQGVALNLQHFLDPFAKAIGNSGFADPATVSSAFNRFSLPSGYVFYLTVRVAAQTTEAAVGVANLVAESNGGALGFRVIAPTRDVPISVLHDPYLDIRGPAWTDRRRKQSLETLGAELAASSVAVPDDEDTVDFLERMPHMYALGEAQRMLELPHSDDEGLPGLDTQPVAPFSVPSLRFLRVQHADLTVQAPPRNRVRVGMVQQPGMGQAESEHNRFSTSAWHSLDPLDLTKHALIVGSTGSGKTMTTTFLVRELIRLNVPVMIIEPVKTEYYDKLKNLVPNLLRLRLEGDTEGVGPGDGYLAFDPLRIPKGITVARHCSFLKSCFEASFGLTDWLAVLLENGLRAYYEDKRGCGLNKFRRGGLDIASFRDGLVYPSFASFQKFLLEVFLAEELKSLSQSRGAGDVQATIDVFRRRFVNLGSGLLGEMFKVADNHFLAYRTDERAYDLFATWLSRPTVIELDGIADADQKALVMAFLLSKLFEHRQAEDFESRKTSGELPPRLRHFLVVEEAHRLLASGGSSAGRGKDVVGESAKAKAVQLFVDMLAEIRAFGQGLAIVEQIPTKIVPEAVKNTNLKIMLRLTANDDRQYLGEAMNFTEAQMRFVTNLKIERNRQINFVVFEEGVDQPIMLALPLPGASAGPVRDPYAAYFQAGAVKK